MENEPFEDVFPIENGDFPLLCLITGGHILGIFQDGLRALKGQIRVLWGDINPKCGSIHVFLLISEMISIFSCEIFIHSDRLRLPLSCLYS